MTPTVEVLADKLRKLPTTDKLLLAYELLRLGKADVARTIAERALLEIDEMLLFGKVR